MEVRKPTTRRVPPLFSSTKSLPTTVLRTAYSRSSVSGLLPSLPASPTPASTLSSPDPPRHRSACFSAPTTSPLLSPRVGDDAPTPRRADRRCAVRTVLLLRAKGGRAVMEHERAPGWEAHNALYCQSQARSRCRPRPPPLVALSLQQPVVCSLQLPA
ncbi:hypothetical protein E2562_030735 [Oryza meyeriana var. granulata]|uniref:Uncharacterized protein n=1 Tax=Oryza meyeriana var. granulata TaxID=110450 RepID=A0A6G1E4N0_9ORYZ|nr:hypothetical protein E2562_030735 [Oryza meyeriana var. granulata]